MPGAWSVALRLRSPKLLASGNYLGCRNPVRLDHILTGPGINNDGPANI
ncbi:UNVERIFIED_ORG: hypothetical protein GGD48_004921 [Rhizobium etli]